MINNPFSTNTFNTIWSKHFNANKPGIHFNSIRNTSFVKSPVPFLYFNSGKNITNGMSYRLNHDDPDYKNKVFLIHDVPSYFDIHQAEKSKLKVIKVPQHKGFLADLSQFETYDDFAKNQFKSNTRYKFRRNQERLETCFNIRYSIYHGHIEKPEYEAIMIGFNALITKRFNALQKDNDILETWDYYYELIYNMLIEKRALLITIYNEDKPIGVSLSFLSDTTMFYAITSFDTDYYRYNLGHTTIIKLFQWCFNNGYSIYDFSKGEYEYKNRWTNNEYTYENHILYDSKSIVASIIAHILKYKYQFKQYLRDKNINEKYVELKFFLKGKKSNSKRAYAISDIEDTLSLEGMDLVNINDDKYSHIKPIVYDRLYKSPIPLTDLKIYETSNTVQESYVVNGNKNNYKITFN